MKILTSSGDAYQLTPGTQLEIERPNLFFNDWGEQTLPVELPDTEQNRRLTGYPHVANNLRKPQGDLWCAIEEGDYYMPCRQVVLGAKEKESITTSFYMNEGSFLSRINQVPVAAIFGDETVPGVSTVAQGIQWCWSLRDNTDERFAIFPIVADIDGEKRGINIVSLMNSQGTPNTMRLSSSGELPAGYTYGFFHAFARTEKVNGQVVSLSPGYYITPFIRACYLLRRVFEYFGYTLLDNFFTQTEPFRSMVFVNNTADALVNGTILISHLVPDCYCSTLLDVFRKKFCCEFVPDEVARTVRIEFFKEIMAGRSETDLTPCLAGVPAIDYQEPRQLKLSSGNVTTESNTFESASELAQKYPTAYYDAATGQYKRRGYGTRTVLETVSDGNLPFFAAEEGFEEYEVQVPDSPFGFSNVVYYLNLSSGVSQLAFTAPYIGEGRMLNSQLTGVSEEDEDAEAVDAYLSTSSHEQSPVLAFVSYKNGRYATGTNHDPDRGYSLLYNGPIGIYETFWRDFDDLLRNSLHRVTAPLLPGNALKNSLRVHRKVSLRGADYLCDVFKYTLGGKNAPIETTLFTTQLFEPVSKAMPESERMAQVATYRWRLNYSATKLTEAQWVAAGYEAGALVAFPVIYPPAPTRAQYEAGGTYYARTVYYSSTNSRTGELGYYKAEESLSVEPW